MARSVTITAGNRNVELPNGYSYNATSPAQGPFAITAVASNGTTVTFTAANNLTAGQTVTLSGLAGGYTGLNGAQTVASASSTQFTVTNPTASGATTTGTATVTGINGPTVYLSDAEGSLLNPANFSSVLVDNGTVVGPVRSVTIVAGNSNVQLPNGTEYNAANAVGAIAITAVSASAGVVTLTATNTFTAGESVFVSGLGGGYTSLNGVQAVLASTGTAFTITSAATGATTTGFVSANGPTVYLTPDQGSLLNPANFPTVLVDNGWIT